MYRARDTKLDRDVALKVLPHAFTDDPDRLARFEREAKVLASLNHPNIGHIYGLEEAEGQKALVLELVEGPTLAERIKQGPIPVEEALPIAKQIAEALEAAHEAGVIHRDLKPANIKVKDDGTVKVLDFGLAKALDTAPEGDPSLSPTLTAAATQMGVIMGTAAYMSPEQAKGRTVDKRADVWAFGAVLFEMLTGRRAFPGEDLTDTIAAVMKSEPAWDALPADTAPRLTQILHACLEKDRARRVRDIGDVQLAMEGAFESLQLPTGAAESSGNAGWRRSRLYVVGGIALVVMAIGAALRGGDDDVRPVQRFALSLPSTAKPWFDGLGGMPISPDGTRLVYVTMVEGQRVLAAQRLGQRDVQILPGTEGALRPFFSPDSQRVGFFSGPAISTPETFTALTLYQRWTLKHVPLEGGTPTVLASDVRALGATWGDDESIVFGGEGLQRVPASGGTPDRLTEFGPAELFHARPHLLPGSRAVLFSGGSPTSSRIFLHSIGTGERTDLAAGIEAFYVPSGHLVVRQPQAGLPSGNILASPFDLDSLTLSGPLVLVEENVRRFSVSGVGTLLYSGFSGDSVAEQLRSFVWVDRQRGEEAVDLPPGDYSSPRLSPDGTEILFGAGDDEDADIFLHDLVRGRGNQLTFGPSEDGFPLWTPDGKRFAFASRREGSRTYGAFWRAVDGTGQAEPLAADSERTLIPYSWSPDGQTLLFSELALTGATNYDIGALSMDGGGSRTAVLNEPYLEAGPEISPNGQWLAYVAVESGAIEVYVCPFPEVESGKWLISKGGGGFPAWSRDGSELFYLKDRSMMAVAIETAAGAVEHGQPRALFEGDFFTGIGRQFNVAPNAERFLMLKRNVPDTTEPAEQIVVLNWHEELKRLVPTN